MRLNFTNTVEGLPIIFIEKQDFRIFFHRSIQLMNLAVSSCDLLIYQQSESFTHHMLHPSWFPCIIKQALFRNLLKVPYLLRIHCDKCYFAEILFHRILTSNNTLPIFFQIDLFSPLITTFNTNNYNSSDSLTSSNENHKFCRLFLQ